MNNVNCLTFITNNIIILLVIKVKQLTLFIMLYQNC